ncbi:MAG TPA: histidine phosphatase family protein, partial [Acidimicrobiales bacterium]|nr:histidine phosphatase family protein [Acidimicrobiales bacterium]
EQDLGEWNGLTTEEIGSRWPHELEARRQGLFGPVPGGEAAAHFAARAVTAVRRVASEVTGAGRDAIVVAHGGVLIALEQALGTWSPSNRHTNLSGWWVEAWSTPEGIELLALRHSDLLATSPETVTGRG